MKLTNKKNKEIWHQAYLLRRAGMKESYLILRNAWFTKEGVFNNYLRLEFLSDDFLE
ncbi:hypothetical protein LCGC14_1733240 [marine sediment metagenome]|uniref:Uncharacterized protein n=1 Tax=marine sediment metagenome TaxID=412755 RepID=A0A0F9H8Q2_9ZZZZ